MQSVLQYKCPCCGGGLSFDKSIQMMKCPFCETEFDAAALEEFNAVEEHTPEACAWQQSDIPWEDSGLQGFTCPSCAGELMTDAKTAATRCPYCGNPTVMPSRLSGMFQPDFVIPFRLDKDAAQQGFADKLKGKKLLPKSFRDESVLEEIVGSYVPFWLFDCSAKAHGTWRATRVKVWSDRRFRYTKTDHFQLRRSGEASFVQVPVDACSKMDNDYMDAIEPFDYNGLQPFKMSYLSGYLADKYDVTAEQSRPRVERRAAESMEQAMSGTAQGGGYNSATRENGQTWLTQGRASYTLMPVWNLNAKFEDKSYRFAMNGQTGKFIGELPVDKKRAAAWFFGLFGGFALAAVLIMLLLSLSVEFLLIGLGVAGLFAWSVVAAMKKQMKTAHPQKTACNYMRNFRLTQQKDIFLYSNTVRVRINQQNTVAARPGGGGRPGGGMSGGGARPMPKSGGYKGGGYKGGKR